MVAIHLRHSDPALFSQFLLGFLARIRVRQVGVEIFVQHLCSLLVEVTPLTSDKRRQEIMTNVFGMCMSDTTKSRCSHYFSPQENNQPSHTHTQRNRQRKHTSQTPTDRPGIKEAWSQNHDSLTGALFELHLNGAEFAVDDGHHALNLLGWDGPCARLLSQQVHYMVGELTAGLGRGERKELNAIVKTELKHKLYLVP